MRQILIEKYIHPSEIESDKDNIIEYWKNEYGENHNIFDHPSIVIYDKKMQLIEQGWVENGQIHRDKNPAIIGYDDNNKIKFKKWFRRDVIYRDGNLPAEIYYEYGKVKDQYWYKDGIEIKQQILNK
jgi:hypothetical protein